MDNTEMNLASKRLFGKDGLNVSNIKLYPGSSREATPEQIADALNKSISNIESGDFEEVDISDD